jgi:UDP-N-acetylglucosamine 2-epimerase (non-hydrolysing)
MIIFGTRPEAIKLCPLIKKLNEFDSNFETIVCVSAQHRQMLDQVLNIFEVKPKYDLDIMSPDQTLFDVTTNILKKIRNVFVEEKPDFILVQGDTTTTFTVSLAAFYEKIPVGHVEAGLRTGDKYSPFPEEMNRKLTTSLADLHFAPTENNKSNLLKENILSENIFVTGNTVIDSLFSVIEKIRHKNFPEFTNVNLNKKYILVTGHRRENFGSDIINICETLKEIAIEHKDIEIIYPAHLNPNILNPVNNYLRNINNIHILPPLNYEPFVRLMQNSYIIITDSGGIQEESPAIGKPTLVTRKTTERPEALKTAVVKLVGTDKASIKSEVNRLIYDQNYYQSMSKISFPYGDGKASLRIVKCLLKFFDL